MDLQFDDEQVKEIEPSDFIDQNNETSHNTVNISECTEACISDCLSNLTINVPIDNYASNNLICLNNSDVEIDNCCMPENGVDRTGSVHTEQKIVDDIQDVDSLSKMTHQDLIIETNIPNVLQNQEEISSSDESSDEITRENPISSNKNDTMQSINSENQLPLHTNIHTQHETSESTDPMLSNFKNEELEDEVELLINQDLLTECDIMHRDMYKENENIKSKSTEMGNDITATNIEPFSELVDENNENKDSKTTESFKSEILESLPEFKKDDINLNSFESNSFIENQSIYMELGINVDDLPDSSVPKAVYSSVESNDYMSLSNIVIHSSITELIPSDDSSNSSDSSTTSDSDSPSDSEKKISTNIRKSLNSLNNFSHNDDETHFQDIKVAKTKSLEVLNDESYFESDSPVIKPIPALRERKLKIQSSVQSNHSTGCSVVQSSSGKPKPTPRKKRLESRPLFPSDGNQNNNTNCTSSDSKENFQTNPKTSETHTSTRKKSFPKLFGLEKSQNPKTLFNNLKVFFKKNNKSKKFPTKFYTNDI